MANDLVSIYESNFLKPQNVVEEKKELPDFIKKKIAERKGESSDSEKDEDEDETHDEAVKRKMKKAKKSKNSMKNKSKEPNPGEIYGDSFNRSGNIFDQILREMDEMGGGNFGSSSMDDNVFNADDQMDSGEEETFTLSELRSMSLGELANLLAGGDDEGEDYGEELEDGIPAESYGFTGGEGNYKGDQGNYDGKAKKQAPTSHVKANGDADFGKANTGIKTSSGKKPKNYF